MTFHAPYGRYVFSILVLYLNADYSSLLLLERPVLHLSEDEVREHDNCRQDLLQICNCRRGMNVFVYYQMCPECKEPVIGVRELKDLLALSIDVQDLTLYNELLYLSMFKI
jgi:hypothetical protein